ncbi:hypothetical protein PMAYCL1PPCAC_32393, partial [Pristionchus mayeri]
GTMCDAKPEVIEKFKAGRATLKFRDLLLSEKEDLAKFQAACYETKSGLSDEVLKELEGHKREIAAILGLPMGPVGSPLSG